MTAAVLPLNDTTRRVTGDADVVCPCGELHRVRIQGIVRFPLSEVDTFSHAVLCYRCGRTREFTLAFNGTEMVLTSSEWSAPPPFRGLTREQRHRRKWAWRRRRSPWENEGYDDDI